jgi:hypothetical protein
LSNPVTSTSEQQAVELFEAVAHELAAGRKRQHLVGDLVKQGWSADAAEQFVACVQNTLREHRQSKAGRSEQTQGALGQIQWGLTWIAGGGVAVFVTRKMADPNNLHMLAYVAVLYGLFELSWGLARWLQYRDPQAPVAAKPTPAKKL